MNFPRKVAAILCLLSFLSGGFFLFTGDVVSACSRVLSADNGQAVLVGRNMDWPEDTGTALWVLPRGIQHEGLPGKNLVAWTSKYGSIVAATLSDAQGSVTDGMNEQGLMANLLWLNQSDYGIRDAQRQGLSISFWAQYMLDNFATVEEAVQAIRQDSFQIVTLQFPDTAGKIKTASLHLSLADKTGDSAIIEYIGGKPVIHHDRSYTIMTNDPPFEQQQANLKQYEGFGGTKPIPGSTAAADRFVRAAYYMKLLPKPVNLREALAGIFSVTRNISQPFRVSLDASNPFSSTTIWRSTGDLTHRVYFFESTTSPYLIWASLDGFNLTEGSPAMRLDLRNYPDYYGNVTKNFAESDPAELMNTSL